MTDELQKLDLKGIRISGVNGRNLSVEEKALYSEELNKKYFRHSLTEGEIGCYLGHRKIWQHMVENQIERAIILEDDVLFHDNFPAAIEAFSTLKRVELVKLQNAEGDLAYQKVDLPNDLQHVNYQKIPNCAAAYGLTLSAAKKLLSRQVIYRPVDWDFQLCNELNLSVTGIEPYSVEQRMGVESDIVSINKGQHANRAKYFWRNIRFRASVFWHRKNHLSGPVDFGTE